MAGARSAAELGQRGLQPRRQRGRLDLLDPTSSQPTQDAASISARAIGSVALAVSSESLRATRVRPSLAGSTLPTSRPPASSGIVK